MNFTTKSLMLIFKILEKINTFILRIGRQLAWIAILLMVIVIILQVFLSIDMLERFLPKILSNILVFIILIISFTVLLIGFEMGLKHINAGWIFSSSSIKIPFSLIGGKTEAMKLAWMYMSLPVGIFLLILVNIELVLRTILSLFNSQIKLPLDKDREELEA